MSKAEPLTFTNHRIKSFDATRVIVMADCIEAGREAYAVVRKGDGAIDEANATFALMKLPT